MVAKYAGALTGKIIEKTIPNPIRTFVTILATFGMKRYVIALMRKIKAQTAVTKLLILRNHGIFQ